MISTARRLVEIRIRPTNLVGYGFSNSSCMSVCQKGALYQFCSTGLPLDLDRVIHAALLDERQRGVGAIAAQDVATSAWGGVCLVRTYPNIKSGRIEFDGEIVVERVVHIPRWLTEHVVVAFKPDGQRHDAPDLLSTLFEHPRAGAFVAALSRHAETAGQAVTACDAPGLAVAVNAARDLFNDWTHGVYLGAVQQFAERMVAELELHQAGWKPPGAGGAEALIVVVPDPAGTVRVVEYLAGHGWWAQPVRVTQGVQAEILDDDRAVRVTAGHRIDFVGAADLGQDVLIGVPGVCCACAIEPRAEVIGYWVEPK